PGGARRPDEGPRLQGQDLGADDARGGAPEEEDDEQDDEAEAGLGDRDDDHGEGQEGYAEGDVGQAHQHLVDPAAEIAGDEADERAENDAAEGREQAD